MVKHARKHKKILEDSKLINMPEEWSTDKVSNKIKHILDGMKKKNPNMKTSKTLGRILMKSFKFDIFRVLSLMAICDFAAIINTFVLSFFFKWLRDENAEEWRGYMYACIMAVLLFIASVVRDVFFVTTAAVGISVRKGLSGLVFKKILSFSQRSKSKATSGKLVSILSGELQMIERSIIILPAIVIAPVIL